jgi:hypothetical protein
VEVRVELVSGLPELHQALAGHDPLQRVGDRLEAALELAVLAGPVQVVVVDPEEATTEPAAEDTDVPAE